MNREQLLQMQSAAVHCSKFISQCGSSKHLNSYTPFVGLNVCVRIKSKYRLDSIRRLNVAGEFTILEEYCWWKCWLVQLVQTKSESCIQKSSPQEWIIIIILPVTLRDFNEIMRSLRGFYGKLFTFLIRSEEKYHLDATTA